MRDVSHFNGETSVVCILMKIVKIVSVGMLNELFDHQPFLFKI